MVLACCTAYLLSMCSLAGPATARRCDWRIVSWRRIGRGGRCKSGWTVCAWACCYASPAFFTDNLPSIRHAMNMRTDEECMQSCMLTTSILLTASNRFAGCCK